MSMNGKLVRAVRGAITVERDSADAIHEGTSELLREVLGRNELVADDLVSIIFTATPDLTTEFPAVAAREMGLSGVPLLCAREIPVEGAMPLCVRVMIHCYFAEEREIRHVYLRDARQLRTDLPE